MNKKEVYYTISIGDEMSHELGELPLFNSKHECFKYANDRFGDMSYNIVKVELSLTNSMVVSS